MGGAGAVPPSVRHPPVPRLGGGNCRPSNMAHIRQSGPDSGFDLSHFPESNLPLLYYSQA